MTQRPGQIERRGPYSRTGRAGRQRQRRLKQPGAGCGVHSPIDATPASQAGVGSGDERLDVLVGDVAPHDRELHARILVGALPTSTRPGRHVASLAAAACQDQQQLHSDPGICLTRAAGTLALLFRDEQRVAQLVGPATAH